MHLFSVTDIIFHGNLNRQFSKTYELFDDRSVKTVWRLCLNFERTFQTSSSEKFCAASFKLPLKTRTWKVKEKKKQFDPELHKNYPEYRCHEQGIP